MVMAVFLGLNDHELVAAETDVVTTIVALASGELGEETLEDWVRRHARKRPIRREGPTKGSELHALAD